jgi:HK97 family phage portal protein
LTSTFSALASVIANKTPVPLTLPVRSRTMLGTYGTSTNGQLRAMESDGVLFAVVAKSSEALAGVQWRLYRKRTKSTSDSQRQEITQHLALQVWNKPNAFMSRQRLVETFAQHHYLVGESWLVATRDTPNGPVRELWPVRPDRMRPIEDPVEFIAGYEYASPGGEIIQLRREDVICIMRPNPSDPYRGLGPVQGVMAHIDAARYSAEWNRNFFINSAEPGGVLSVEGTLGDRDFNRLNAQWNEQHRGTSAAHRVAILENGVKWTPNIYTRRDMQFAELMEVGDDKILKAFAFPKFMLGVVDDVNKANAQASEYVFAKWTLIPALERIKDALNNIFLPMLGAYGEGVEFDYDSPIPDDTEAEDASLAARSLAASNLIAAGFYAPSVREALALPEMDYGEPGADPQRELLIKLVTAAPAALFDKIAPLLGIELPEPEPVVEPVPPEPQPPALDPATDEPEEESEGDPAGPVARIENAQKWVAKASMDENTCQPCKDNNGKTYKNREEAYRDYPGGSSYVNCEGEEHGNECRCTVVKRGKSDNDATEEVSDG